MDKFNLDDEIIKEIIFSVCSSQKYWIQKIERQKHDELTGTVVILKLKDSTASEDSYLSIRFEGDHLEVNHSEDVVFSKDQEELLLQKYYLKAPPYASGFERLRKQVDEDFYRIATSILKVGGGDEGFRGLVYGNNHATFYPLQLRNLHNPQDGGSREIKIGGIYVANLPPVPVDRDLVGNTGSGRRPVLIIGHVENTDNLICVPFFSNEGVNVGYINEKLPRLDSRLAVRKVQTISPVALYDYLGELPPEDYQIVVREVQKGFNIIPIIDTPVSVTVGFKRVSDKKKDDRMEFLSDEEILQLVTDRIKHLESRRGAHFPKDDNGEYVCELTRSNDGSVLVKINAEYDEGYDWIDFYFRETDVEMDFSKYSVSIVDRAISCLYRQKMLEKNSETYPLVALRGLVKSWNHHNSDSAVRAQEIERDFELLGFYYQGDIEGLLGEEEINPDLIRKVEDESDSTVEIVVDGNNGVAQTEPAQQEIIEEVPHASKEAYVDKELIAGPTPPATESIKKGYSLLSDEEMLQILSDKLKSLEEESYYVILKNDGQIQYRRYENNKSVEFFFNDQDVSGFDMFRFRFDDILVYFEGNRGRERVDMDLSIDYQRKIIAKDKNFCLKIISSYVQYFHNTYTKKKEGLKRQTTRTKKKRDEELKHDLQSAVRELKDRFSRLKIDFDGCLEDLIMTGIIRERDVEKFKFMGERIVASEELPENE